MFDDYTGTWTDDLAAASEPTVDTTPIDIPSGGGDSSSGGGWAWTETLASYATKALATYQTLAKVENDKRGIEIAAQTAENNQKLQAATQAANAKLAERQLTTQSTLAQLQSAAAIATAQAKAAIPQVLAAVTKPQTLLLIGAGLAIAWAATR
jgi:hypothetical protein